VAGEEAGKGLDPGRAAEAAELTKDLEVAIARRDEVSRRSQARASVTALGAVAFLSGFAGTAFPTVGTGGVTPAAATSAFALGAGVAFLGIALRFAIDSLQARCGGDRSA